MKRAVTVWWGMPCKSMTPVFQALHEQHGRDVSFVALHDLPDHRRKLGWVLPPHGSMPLDVLGEDWRRQVAGRVAGRPGVHIVNGIYHDERVRYVARALAGGQGPFGVIMEAPSNLESGARRIAKGMLAPLVTPLRTWPVARKAEFVMSASGDRNRAFRALGFPRDRIFPFGYFPDYPLLDRPDRAAAGQGGTALDALCIGYLEPFKGQDVLLRAIAILSAKGVPVRCTITGYGSARERLSALAAELGLEGTVTFAGVVSNERLLALFRDSSVLVAPGHEEPWGIRVNEALLSGLPVVVSDGVGAHELVATSGAGEVFRSGSAQSLADAMERARGRLQSGGDLVATVRRFRPAIAPSAAAAYLDEVIALAEVPPGVEVMAGRPEPPWLDAAWRGRKEAA